MDIHEFLNMLAALVADNKISLDDTSLIAQMDIPHVRNGVLGRARVPLSIDIELFSDGRMWVTSESVRRMKTQIKLNS
jgi:hypothetical protein